MIILTSISLYATPPPRHRNASRTLAGGGLLGVSGLLRLTDVIAKSEKPGGIVVKDVTLLGLREEVRIDDSVDARPEIGEADVRAKHDAIPIARIHNALQVRVVLSPRDRDLQGAPPPHTRWDYAT